MNEDLERSIKDRIKKLSREDKRQFNLLWNDLVLERFLVRLSKSSYENKIIFKGGRLLSHYIAIGRETKDLDFLFKRKEADSAHVKEVLEDISQIDLHDGFIFKNVSPNRARGDGEESVFRWNIECTCGKTKAKLFIDIGIEDTVRPLKRSIPLMSVNSSPIFEEKISLLVYPPEYIFSEKLEAIIARGSGNSRMKDFHDLLSIISSDNVVSHKNLRVAIKETFTHRATEQKPLHKALNIGASDLETMWANYLTVRKRKGVSLPESFTEVVDRIDSYLKEHDLLSTIEISRRKKGKGLER